MAELFKRNNLRNRFKNGEKPDGTDFSDWIDSSINQKSDRIYASDGKLGIGTAKPEYPLEVHTGKHEEHISCKIQNDRYNSSLLIGSPAHKQTALGVGRDNKLLLGHFLDSEKTFSPGIEIYHDGKVTIGSEHQKGRLEVIGSLALQDKIEIGGLVLGTENGRLVVWIDGKAHVLAFEDENPPPPGGRWLLMVLIMASVFLLVALIASIAWGPFF